MILIAATVAGYKCYEARERDLWLTYAERWQADYGVAFFLAAQVGQGHDEAVEVLAAKVRALSGDVWRFSLDDGVPTIDSISRNRYVVIGRNLIAERVLSDLNVSHVLQLDTDLEPHPNTIPMLLALGWPVAGGDVREYCLTGPEVYDYEFPVEEHMNTAGYLLIERGVFEQGLRWRNDLRAAAGGGVTGNTDDPAFHADCLERGITWRVRKDCVGMHRPLVPVEQRGHDLAIRRESMR